MKAYLKPEDEQECLRMIKSLGIVSCLWDFDQWLRVQYKYHNKEYCYEIREKLNEFMNEHDINLEELIS